MCLRVAAPIVLAQIDWVCHQDDEDMQACDTYSLNTRIVENLVLTVNEI